MGDGLALRGLRPAQQGGSERATERAGRMPWQTHTWLLPPWNYGRKHAPGRLSERRLLVHRPQGFLIPGPAVHPRTTLASSVSRAVPFHPSPRKNAHVQAGRQRPAAPRARPGDQGLGSVGPRGGPGGARLFPLLLRPASFNWRATGVLLRVFTRFVPAHRHLRAASRCAGKLPGRGLRLPG